jgi:hypothetical protein
MKAMLKSTAWLLATAFVLSAACTQKTEQKQLLVFNNDLEVFSLGQGSPLEQWLKCDKVVVYQSLKIKDSGRFQWHEYIEKYPHVKFIFIVQAQDEARIKEFLLSYKLDNYSIFWDRHNRFKKDNKVESEVSFIAFLVDKENKVVGLSNPTIPDFSKRLAKLDGC